MGSDAELEFPAAPLSPSLPSVYEEEETSDPSGQYLVRLKLFHDEAQPRPPHTPTKRQDQHKQEDASQPVVSRPPSNSAHVSPEKRKRQAERQAVRESAEFKSSEAAMNRWVDLARTKKHDGDHAAAKRHHRLAVVSGLDALICFMVGFAYGDRCDAMLAGLPFGKPVFSTSWATLVPYLVKLASYVESVDAEMAGLCHQVLAVVRLHIAYLNRKEAPPEESSRTLFSVMSDFRRGLSLFPLANSLARYHLSEDGWGQTRVNPDRPDPVNNRATLPLHVNSSLAEAAAFALKVGCEWTQLENFTYDWAAAAND